MWENINIIINQNEVKRNGLAAVTEGVTPILRSLEHIFIWHLRFVYVTTRLHPPLPPPRTHSVRLI